MLSLAICDDNKIELGKTSLSVGQYIKEREDLKVRIDTYSCPTDLVNKAKNGEMYDIYVLDIIMDPISGIELAKTLKTFKKDIKVVFTTTSKDFAVDAFEIKAEHYIIKPYTKEQIKEALDRVFDFKQEDEYLVKNTSKGLKKIPVKSICYSESNGHYQYILLESGEVLKIRLKTNELWEELSKYEQFTRPHSGYIVNMDYVKTITAFGMSVCGKDIPIAKNTLGKVKHTFLEYTFNKKK